MRDAGVLHVYSNLELLKLPFEIALCFMKNIVDHIAHAVSDKVITEIHNF